MSDIPCALFVMVGDGGCGLVNVMLGDVGDNVERPRLGSQNRKVEDTALRRFSHIFFGKISAT